MKTIKYAFVLFVLTAMLLPAQSVVFAQEPCDYPKSADYTNDWQVDIYDLAKVADYMGRGMADVFDLARVATHYGKSAHLCPVPGTHVTGVSYFEDLYWTPGVESYGPSAHIPLGGTYIAANDDGDYEVAGCPSWCRVSPTTNPEAPAGWLSLDDLLVQ